MINSGSGFAPGEADVGPLMKIVRLFLIVVEIFLIGICFAPLHGDTFGMAEAVRNSMSSPSEENGMILKEIQRRQRNRDLLIRITFIALLAANTSIILSTLKKRKEGPTTAFTVREARSGGVNHDKHEGGHRAG